MIILDHVEKTYSKEKKIGPITVELKPGTSLGIIGANGAGKSTLFSMITGSIAPTSGHVNVFGSRMRPESHDLRKKIGYLPQDLVLPPWSDAISLLEFSSIIHFKKIDHGRILLAIEKWDITSYQNVPFIRCSHGMQKRIGLALAFFHCPKILILDEPFSGLDLYHTKTLTHSLEERKSGDSITIVSSHIIPYIAQITNRISFLRKGKLELIEPYSHLTTQLEKIAFIEKTFFES